jgi:prophage maintenance system killer protein/prophage antirepressor-like protein
MLATMSTAAMTTDVLVYKEGEVQLSVNVKDETVWLTQADIASLFGVQAPAVSKHVKNIYKDGELKPKATCSKMETVRKEGKRTVKRSVETFNLDMVLSIGYRVNSKRATQFRIWATNLLKQHVLKGYTLNERRLPHTNPDELTSAVRLIRKAMERRELSAGESEGLLKVITDYAQTWLLLDRYEKGSLPSPSGKSSGRYRLELDDARSIVRALQRDLLRRHEATDAFGKERGGILVEILGSIEKEEASIETKAANLLYQLIKKSPFEDGNKRLAAFLFIVYLTKSQYLSGWRGERKFNDTALVALVLLIAESEPQQERLIHDLIVNFVHG